MSGSVTCIGRKSRRGCGGRATPVREAVLAEVGCYSTRPAKKGKAVLDLLGERHPCVSENVVTSGDGGDLSRTCRVTIFC